jgi:hypothetical protein
MDRIPATNSSTRNGSAEPEQSSFIAQQDQNFRGPRRTLQARASNLAGKGVLIDLLNTPVTKRIGTPESTQVVRPVTGPSNRASPSSICIPLIRLEVCLGVRMNARRSAAPLR